MENIKHAPKHNVKNPDTRLPTFYDLSPDIQSTVMHIIREIIKLECLEQQLVLDSVVNNHYIDFATTKSVKERIKILRSKAMRIISNDRSPYTNHLKA